MFLNFLLIASSLSLANAAQDPVEAVIGSTIDNFHAVAAGKIYRGAIPGADGLFALARAGIKTEIDLQGGDEILGIPLETGESAADIQQERETAQANGIRFVGISLSAINPDFDDQNEQIDQVLDLITDPANQPVYFHCRHGSDRTGLIGALYRVLYQGCTPEQAHQEMMDYGHSSMLPWIDDDFYDRVNQDPRTHFGKPGPLCPLP